MLDVRKGKSFAGVGYSSKHCTMIGAELANIAHN